MKKLTIIMATVWMAVIMACPAFAGAWNTGQAPNQDRWWYERDDGSYVANGWEWIDGDQDGVAECYYFDENGWLYTGAVTPDGYSVNADGAWIENGTVKTKKIQNHPDFDFIRSDEEIPAPYYWDYTIFNSERSTVKYITLGCEDEDCTIYYTVGANPSDPSEDDEKYQTKYDGFFDVYYGTPKLKPGQTLKAVAVKDGAVSDVTVLRYEDARSANKGRSGRISGSSSSDYEDDEYEDPYETVSRPYYLDFAIFDSDRSNLKYIMLGCEEGCTIYYTVGVNPSNPTKNDEKYKTKYNRSFGLYYGSPMLKPGQTLKAIAVKGNTVSNVTTLRYEDAHAGNKGRSGNIAASPTADPGYASGNSNNNDNSNSSATGPRTCPVCFGTGSVTCSYCHGSGIGQNASIGIGGDIWQGTCPNCGGAGSKICSGCAGTGQIGY